MAHQEHAMIPSDARRRIAFLLERTQAPTDRVRAFRNAAASLDEAGADEIARLAKLRKLKDLFGVGDTIERIVLDALAGRTPEYLSKLEGTESEPLVAGGETMRALLMAASTPTTAPCSLRAPRPEARWNPPRSIRDRRSRKA